MDAPKSKSKFSSRRIGFYTLLATFIAAIVTNLINNKNVLNPSLMAALVTSFNTCLVAIFAQKRMDGPGTAVPGATAEVTK